MCQWFLPCIEENPVILQGIVFSDEANFCINGEVDKQNTHTSLKRIHSGTLQIRSKELNNKLMV
jgi:hypothetical protein